MLKPAFKQAASCQHLYKKKASGNTYVGERDGDSEGALLESMEGNDEGDSVGDLLGLEVGYNVKV